MDLVKEYTVSEIVKDLKNTIEGKYFYIKIKGEISGLKKHPSGHFYFSLKDENAMINAVMFKNYADFCKIDLQDGVEIIAVGKISVYKERSSYQMLVESVQISGIGALLKLIEDRKNKLAKEGLFDTSRKKPIPKMPKNVGIITAESGAAIHDILSRLKNRTPITIFLYSSLMQGKNAPEEIIEAIKYFNSLKDKPQVLVITRGGGSIEDLMAFNDENLVRAVANSKIPIISAVGHEVDWTLIDYASDLRLPTPTSVAEYLTISKEQAYINLNNLFVKLYSVLCEKNIRKTNYLKTIFSHFLMKKISVFKRKVNILNFLKIRLFGIIKLKIQKHKSNVNCFKKININSIISKVIKEKSTKIKFANLKVQNFQKKYPILKNTLGHVIKLKNELILNKNYILEFPDGNVKIKIIKV